MPRKPTEKVVEHRITLGSYERKLLSDAAGAYQFKSVANPIITFINDNTSLLLLLAVIGSYLDTKLDPDWRSITKDLTPSQLSDWLETQNLVGGGLGALLGAFLGGPLGAAAGFGVGVAAVEGIEGVGSAAAGFIEEEVRPSAVVTGILGIYRTIDAVTNIGDDII